MDDDNILYVLLAAQIHTQILCITIAMVGAAYYLEERRMLRNLVLARHETRITYLDSVIGDSDTTCINQLRMDKRCFGYLCELLRSRGGLKANGQVSIEEQVCMFLHIIAHHVKHRTIGNRFLRSQETVSRCFNSVLKAILRLQEVLLQQPDPVPENCTDERWKWFKNCLGALDGTYIKLHVPEVDKPRYRTRKGEIATNVLGACSRDMMFTFVLPGWEGSASDSRVLRDALSRPTGLKVRTGCYYLVDAGYSNAEGFLAPYRGTRYHLSAWRGQYSPQNHKECFNMKHASARNVIERCFGILKKRWAILRSPSFYPVKTQCRVITACCLLHNLIRRQMSHDPLEHEVGDMLSDDHEVNTDFIHQVSSTEGWNNMEGQSSNRSADQYSDHSKSRRIWSDVEINALLDVLDDIVAHQGTCDNGTFRPGTARQVEQALATLLPGTDLRASPHIESKMKKLKRDYVTIFDMLSTSGFGWDDARKCVLVDSDEAWLAYVQHHPQARGWRNKSYPIYDRLAHIFGKDRATGIGVETPADMAADTDNEELEINADEVAEGMSPLSGNNSQTSHRSNQSASSSGKRKRNPGGLDKMTATLHGVLERSCNNMEKILEAVTTKRGVDTKFIGDELKKMGYSVYDRARLLKLFGEQPINVDIFKSFDTMEEREEFVLSLYSGL